MIEPIPMHLSFKSVIQQGKPLHFNHLCGQFHNFENMVDATRGQGTKTSYALCKFLYDPKTNLAIHCLGGIYGMVLDEG
jgi:hypothetical protein